LIESDLLEAIVGLPDQLFYNTNIFTYVWVVTNRKRPERQGFIQLIDARDLYEKMRKSLGEKRNEISDEQIAEITRIYEAFASSDRSHILPNEAFGYRRITVERPLRVRYEVSTHGIETAAEAGEVTKLPAGDSEPLLDGLRGMLGENYATFDELDAALQPVYAKLPKTRKPLRNAVAKALRVRDANADPVEKPRGGLEPDSQLRDTENVPFGEDISEFMRRKVLNFAPDAWVDEAKTRIGYEIAFTREFYKYIPPRPLDEIDEEITESQQRILALLSEVTT
jgi:type I restriction enzyme M protein